jgi:hypothetical protein
MSKYLLAVIIIFSNKTLSQTQISEINDKDVAKRVLRIRVKTDSFLKSKTQTYIFKKFKAEFEATYNAGEMYGNLSLLNRLNVHPEEINELNQYYILEDKAINLLTGTSVYYEDFKGLEIRFSSISDSLNF